MKNKKGQLQMITPAILVLVLGAVILVFGLLMLDQLVVSTGTTSGTDYNTTTVARVTEKCANVYNASACAFNSMSVLYAVNYTNKTDTGISSSNYTWTSRGQICIVEGSVYNNTYLNVTYSYKWSDTEACKAGNLTIGGMGKFSDYWGLIVLAIVVAVIISLLLIVFNLRKTQ